MRTKLNMNTFRSLFGAAILTLASMPASAALMAYTDRTAWESAFLANGSISGSIETELFQVPKPNAEEIIFGLPGHEIKSVAVQATNRLNAIGPLDAPSPQTLAAYYGLVGGGSGSTEITWMFTDPIFGFFADFTIFSSSFPLIATMGNSQAFEIKTGDAGFGVLAQISTDQFSGVSWSSLGSQSFIIDNFSYVKASAVPVPPALWLFGTGLLGLIGFSRRSKAARPVQ